MSGDVAADTSSGGGGDTTAAVGAAEGAVDSEDVPLVSGDAGGGVDTAVLVGARVDGAPPLPDDDAETAPLAPPPPPPSATAESAAGAPLPAAVAPEDAHFVAHLRRDPYLVLHRTIYFFGMGSNAAYYPFAVQLWSSPDGAGLDMASCGAVYAAGHIAAMLAAPTLSALADRSERWRRTVLVAGFVAQAAAVLLMSRAHSFASVAATQVLIEAVASGVWTGVDAATQRLLEVTKGGTAQYGNTRAFGALGWGACAWAFGAAFDAWGLRLAFALFVATSVPAAALACWLPLEKRAATGAGRASALRALVRRDVAVVLAVVLISAMLLQIVDIYRFPFLRSIGASNQLLGASLAMTAASEAPFFFVTSWILARTPLRTALAVVLGTYAARFVFYSLLGEPPLSDPAWTLPAELLHGLTFALGWAAATQYVAALLPPELSASAQGLLGALHWGLGSAAGSAAAGAIARTWGWRAMWRAGAALAGLGTLLMLACGAPGQPGAAGGGSGGSGAGGGSEGDGAAAGATGGGGGPPASVGAAAGSEAAKVDA